MNCKLCNKALGDNPRRLRCNSCNTKVRRVRTKNAAIKYLGGHCNRCGFDKHPAALEFHHKNGKKDKVFTIADVANRKWEVVKKELDKCELICSNCHRIEHSNRTEPKILEEASKYKGRVLMW